MSESDFSGEWTSKYAYHESEDTSQHTMMFEHDNHLVGRSLPQADGSELTIELQHDADTNTLSGTWMEATSPTGQYRGAVFRGALHLILSASGDRAAGKWVGHNGALTRVNTGDWWLEKS